MKNLIILVNSCDKYEDAWDPFFKLLQLQWPDCPYPISLVTENKFYKCPFMDVSVIRGGGTPWGYRILNALKNIRENYVVYILEDEFLRSPVDGNALEKMVQYMEEHSDVGVIFIRHTEKQKRDYPDAYFDRDLLLEDKNRMRIIGLSALYRKDYFQKLLRAHESPWEYEQYATGRSRKLPFRVLQYNKSEPVIFDYNDSPVSGYGLTAGKWVKGTGALFKQYGIEVDFSRLGWYEPTLDDYKKYARVNNLALGSILPENLKSKNIQQTSAKPQCKVHETFYLMKKLLKKTVYALKDMHRRFSSLH